MKVVLNKCYGGYGLSDEAIELYLTKKNIPIVSASTGNIYNYYIVGDDDRFNYYSIKDRHDPILVEVVEELGEKSYGYCAELEIIEIPDGCQYQIDEYDGMESIAGIWIEVTETELIKGISQEKLDLAKQGCSIKLIS